jgi:hypothetical protein
MKKWFICLWLLSYISKAFIFSGLRAKFEFLSRDLSLEVITKVIEVEGEEWHNMKKERFLLEFFQKKPLLIRSKFFLSIILI